MFDKILGNDKNKKILENAIKTNKISHSYIFSGIDGIGKKMIAQQFAKSILCLENSKPCNKCKSCIEIETNNNPDYFLIEPDNGKIKIEQIREMQKKVAEKPIISNKKVYIINDADTMTTEAQNCLLKTLEEPPEYIIIMLIASNENNLLSTIKSRCTRLYFEQLSNEEIKTYIVNNYPEDEINEDILEIYQGSIGKVVKLRDKKELYEKVEKIIHNLERKSLIEILQMSEEIYSSKEEIYSILDYINILLLKKSKENTRYVKTIQIVEETKKRLKVNSNYDMCIDNMLFNLWEEINEKNNRS